MPPRGGADAVRRGHSQKRGSIGGVESVAGRAGVPRAASRRAAAEVGLKLPRMGASPCGRTLPGNVAAPVILNRAEDPSGAASVAWILRSAQDAATGL